MSKTVNADLIIQQIRKKKLLTRDIGSQMFNEALDTVITMLEEADPVECNEIITPADMIGVMLTNFSVILTALTTMNIPKSVRNMIVDILAMNHELDEELFSEGDDDE